MAGAPPSQKAPAQPRWLEGKHWEKPFDISSAVTATTRYRSIWLVHAAHPQAPLFGGGAWDAWPGDVLDAMAICRGEAAAIRSHIEAEQLLRGVSHA